MDWASASCPAVTVLTTEMPDQPLLLQLREHGERLGDRAGRGTVKRPDPQVHDVDRVEAEVVEVVVHGLAQLLRSQRRGPAALRVPERADLGHDVQRLGVRVQGLPDDLVGDVRAVIVAGVDVRDAQLHCLPQHGHGRVAVGRRAEHVRAGQLHGPVSHAGDGQVPAHRERPARKCRRRHGISPLVAAGRASPGCTRPAAASACPGPTLHHAASNRQRRPVLGMAGP